MDNIMLKDIESVLFSEDQISSMIERMGDEISRDYADKKLLLVGILKWLTL